MLEILSDSDSSAHDMGYLVLQSFDNKNFSIIDGQQRLTTLSIVILSGLKFLQKLVQQGIDPESKMKRCEEFMKSYIGYIDPITLSPQSKLELNRHNDNFYQTYLVTLEKIPSRGFSQSEHKLRKTFNWFYDKFNEYIVTNQDSGKRIAEVLVTLVDKLFFTVITVTDELNAFKVFETLNARGVRLSSTDLLKNYIFSLIDIGSTHENKFNLLESRWDIITGRIGS
uniref:GmrSD restriction endonucleases N-terminal domain-containing protein n=1 Tax=Arsenophonus endosymbiont of Trialeurodes vaporariorum TaxID=235567 RepID=A0A3B0MQ70_9GAMM